MKTLKKLRQEMDDAKADWAARDAWAAADDAAWDAASDAWDTYEAARVTYNKKLKELEDE